MRRLYGRLEGGQGMFELSENCIGELVRAGLGYISKSKFYPTDERAADGIKLFSPMLMRFDVTLMPVSRTGCPVYFCTGILRSVNEQNDEREFLRPLPGGGQGYDPISASLSCLGELAERLSLCSFGTDDPRVFNRTDDLIDLDVSKLVGYSLLQIDDLGRDYSTFEKLIPGENIEWNSLTKRRIRTTNSEFSVSAQLPSLVALFGEPRPETGDVPRLASSIGCAVWTNMPGARQRAYLELVERDAIAQAWYNRLGISLLPKLVLAKFLPKKIFDFLTEGVRQWAVLTVATDLEAHVVMAFSYLEGGRWTAFGSSAGWDLSSTIDGAIRELLQNENSLQMMQSAYPENDSSAGSKTKIPSALRYARSNSILEDLPFADFQHVEEEVFKQGYSFEGLQAGLKASGLSVWEFDATRPDINVPCIKLFSPDLCTWEPRFGKTRLFDGVVKRGLRKSPGTEVEFAARPFPF
ncbi:MAG: YcaO-like family protein [Roseibium sp.]